MTKPDDAAEPEGPNEAKEPNEPIDLATEALKLAGALKSWAGFNVTPEVRTHLKDALSSLAKAGSILMETKAPKDHDN